MCVFLFFSLFLLTGFYCYCVAHKHNNNIWSMKRYKQTNNLCCRLKCFRDLNMHFIVTINSPLSDINAASTEWPSLLNTAAKSLLHVCVRLSVKMCVCGGNVIAVWELKWQLLNEVSRQTHFFVTLRARKCQTEGRLRLSHTQTHTHIHIAVQSHTRQSRSSFIMQHTWHVS